jgi:hypothetical protein
LHQLWRSSDGEHIGNWNMNDPLTGLKLMKRGSARIAFDCYKLVRGTRITILTDLHLSWSPSVGVEPSHDQWPDSYPKII